MENKKNKKSVKFQGDTLNFYDFIQVFVFTTNHHLKEVMNDFLTRPVRIQVQNTKICHVILRLETVHAQIRRD